MTFPVRLSMLIAIVAFGLPLVCNALILGPVKQQSYLNEPLNAEIEMWSETEIIPQNLKVTLGSTEDFKSAGFLRPAYLNDIHFKIEPFGDHAVIKLSTEGPLLYPTLPFVIQVTGTGVRLTQNYTLLLNLAAEKSPKSPPNPPFFKVGESEGPSIIPVQSEVTPSVEPEALVPELPAGTTPVVLEVTSPAQPEVTVPVQPEVTSPVQQTTPVQSEVLAPVQSVTNDSIPQSTTQSNQMSTFNLNLRPWIVRAWLTLDQNQRLWLAAGLVCALSFAALSFGTYRKRRRIPSSLPISTKSLREEMVMKLELAHQYMEIGDIENAIDLLENVVVNGSERDKEAAQILLAKITQS